MPDTSIDLSEGIPSIRLKVPTAVVPIPPEGFAQLHSPAPGELALRLPDGSVAAVGGGGGGGTNAVDLLGPNGQVLTDGTEPGVGIDISPIPPLSIRLSGPVEDANGQPQAPAAVTLEQREDAPPEPPAGYAVLWCDVGGKLQLLRPAGSAAWAIGTSGGTALAFLPGTFSLSANGDVGAGGNATDFYIANSNFEMRCDVDGLKFTFGGGTMRLNGYATADPHVDGAVWVDPITRRLVVSAG